MKVLFGDTIFYVSDLRRDSLFTWSSGPREDPEDLAAFILCKRSQLVSGLLKALILRRWVSNRESNPRASSSAVKRSTDWD